MYTMVSWKYTCRKCPGDKDYANRRALCRKNRTIKSSDNHTITVPCGAIRKQRSDIGMKRTVYRGYNRRHGAAGKVRKFTYKKNLQSWLTPYWWNQPEGWAVNVFTLIMAEAHADEENSELRHFHAEYNEQTKMRDRFKLFKNAYKEACESDAVSDEYKKYLAQAMHLVYNLYFRRKFGLQGPKQRIPELKKEKIHKIDQIMSEIPDLGVQDNPTIEKKFKTFIETTGCHVDHAELKNLTAHSNAEESLDQHFQDNIKEILKWPEKSNKDKILKKRALKIHFLHFLKYIYAKKDDAFTENQYNAIFTHLFKLFYVNDDDSEDHIESEGSDAILEFVEYLNENFGKAIEVNEPLQLSDYKLILTECYDILAKERDFFGKIEFKLDDNGPRTSYFEETNDTVPDDTITARSNRATRKHNGKVNNATEEEREQELEDETHQYAEHEKEIKKSRKKGVPYRKGTHTYYKKIQLKKEDVPAVINRNVPLSKLARMQHLYKLIRYFRRRTKQLARLAEKQTNSMGYGDEINTRYHEHNSGDDPRLQEKIELMTARTNAKYASVNTEVSSLKSALGDVALVKEDGSKRSNFDIASAIISGPYSSAAMRLASALAEGIDSYKAELLPHDAAMLPHVPNPDDVVYNMFDGEYDDAHLFADDGNVSNDDNEDDDNVSNEDDDNEDYGNLSNGDNEDYGNLSNGDNEDYGNLSNGDNGDVDIPHVFDEDTDDDTPESRDRRNGWLWV